MDASSRHSLCLLCHSSEKYGGKAVLSVYPNSLLIINLTQYSEVVGSRLKDLPETERHTQSTNEQMTQIQMFTYRSFHVNTLPVHSLKSVQSTGHFCFITRLVCTPDEVFRQTMFHITKHSATSLLPVTLLKRCHFCSMNQHLDVLCKRNRHFFLKRYSGKMHIIANILIHVTYTALNLFVVTIYQSWHRCT